MIYYDLPRHWTKRIEPHLTNPALVAILVHDLNKYTFGAWDRPFTAANTPHEFENCDWWIDHHGTLPRYWAYTLHGACHWLVNFNLRLAMLAEPTQPWRILTSAKHSTVWDGANMLFDFNFLAMKISPAECFSMANKKELKPGRPRVTGSPPHWTVERDRIIAERSREAA